MRIVDEIEDPLYQKMVAAYRGRATEWEPVTRSLRDALIGYAVQRCRYYREVVPRNGAYEEIPPLDKAIIRERFHDLLAEGVPEERRVLSRTSGSSGNPLTFYRDSAEATVENISSERFLRRLHGIPLDATMVVVSAAGTAPWKDALPRRWWGRPRPPWHGLRSVDLTPDRVRREVRLWSRLHPYFLSGYATAIDWIADQIDRMGLRLPRKPAAVVTTSETLTDQARQRIGRAFGCPVHSQYGSLEQPWLAGTIPGTRRYVCNPFLSYVEVVGEENRPVEAGETGRVLLTDLNNYVMPFIRYDVGDLAVESEDRFVGGFRLLEEVIGRSSDVLRLPRGKVITPTTLGQFLFGVAKFSSSIRFYQCLQTGPNDLELRVVWAVGADEGVRARLADSVRTIADPDTNVRVVDVPELERLPNGKAWIIRRLVSS